MWASLSVTVSRPILIRCSTKVDRLARPLRLSISWMSWSLRLTLSLALVFTCIVIRGNNVGLYCVIHPNIHQEPSVLALFKSIADNVVEKY